MNKQKKLANKRDARRMQKSMVPDPTTDPFDPNADMMEIVKIAAAKAVIAEGVDIFVFGDGKLKLDIPKLGSDMVCFWASETYLAPALAGFLQTLAPDMDSRNINAISTVAADSALQWGKGQWGILGFTKRPLVEIVARSTVADVTAQLIGF